MNVSRRKWQEHRLIWRGLSLFFVLRPNFVFVPSPIPFLSLLEPCLYNYPDPHDKHISISFFLSMKYTQAFPILENILYLILLCFSAPISFSPLSDFLINTHIASHSFLTPSLFSCLPASITVLLTQLSPGSSKTTSLSTLGPLLSQPPWPWVFDSVDHPLLNSHMPNCFIISLISVNCIIFPNHSGINLELRVRSAPFSAHPHITFESYCKY